MDKPINPLISYPGSAEVPASFTQVSTSTQRV